LPSTAGEVTYWRRPRKDGAGWSATTGACESKAGKQLFYVFSSNAAPFEAGTPYSKFGAYALLNHGGDFGAAAKALAGLGYGAPSQPAGRLVLGASASHGGGQAQPSPQIVRKKMSELRRPTAAEKRFWHGLIPQGATTILSALPKFGRAGDDGDPRQRGRHCRRRLHIGTAPVQARRPEGLPPRPAMRQPVQRLLRRAGDRAGVRRLPGPRRP
jgi:hypothetical protein